MGRRGSHPELAGVLIHGLEGTASPLSAVPAVGCSENAQAFDCAVGADNLQRVSHKPLKPTTQNQWQRLTIRCPVPGLGQSSKGRPVCAGTATGQANSHISATFKTVCALPVRAGDGSTARTLREVVAHARPGARKAIDWCWSDPLSQPLRGLSEGLCLSNPRLFNYASRTTCRDCRPAAAQCC